MDGSVRSRVRPLAVVVAFAAVSAMLSAGVTPAAAAPGAGTARAVTAASAQLPDPAASEAEFVARINQLRADRGLGALTVDPELTAQARRWARTMADAGRIFHASDLSVGVTANWRQLGENVGVGGELGPLFDAFVASPSHYENLVESTYTRVGVGVVNAGDRMFTTHRFMALAPSPPPVATPPAPPAPAPTTVPPTTAAPATTAPPTTVAPTTTPPTTAGPTTVPDRPAASSPKLGPIDRIPELLAGD